MLSITQQLDLIAENQNLLAVDDDPAILSYFREVFAPFAHGSHEQISELMDLMGGQGESHPGVLPEVAQEAFSLTTASGGMEAVELAREALERQQPYTVAFVDMRMPPGINGLETAQRLRELDPRIFIVIVTAYSDHEIEEIQGRLKRDVLFLNKPMSVDEILQTARTLNRGWQEREKNKVMSMQMVENEKMVALGNMAIRIAHEINQPLAYINGILQLQKMEIDDQGKLDLEKIQEEIELGLEQTVRIKDIIDSLRVFAHPGRSKDRFSDLATAVKNAHCLCQGQLVRQHIKLSLSLQPDLPPVAMGPSQLQQILTNLFNNAIDALEEKQASATPSWKSLIMVTTRQEGDRVELVFEDNGPGVPDAILSRVFEPFVTTKEPGKGTGLGLSEIHGLLVEYGGSIDYQPVSEEIGARFLIHIPIYREST